MLRDAVSELHKSNGNIGVGGGNFMIQLIKI